MAAAHAAGIRRAGTQSPSLHPQGSAAVPPPSTLGAEAGGSSSSSSWGSPTAVTAPGGGARAQCRGLHRRPAALLAHRRGARPLGGRLRPHPPATVTRSRCSSSSKAHFRLDFSWQPSLHGMSSGTPLAMASIFSCTSFRSFCIALLHLDYPSFLLVCEELTWLGSKCDDAPLMPSAAPYVLRAGLAHFFWRDASNG